MGHTQGGAAARNVEVFRSLFPDPTPVRFTAGGLFLEGPVFDARGNLWVVSVHGGTVHRIDKEGTWHTVVRTGGEPQGLAISREGVIIGVDRKVGVFTIDPQTEEFSIVTNNFYFENFHGLNDLVIDDRGGVYVTDPYGSSALNRTGRVFYLSVVEPGRAPVKVLDGIAFPNGIALSPDGSTLYIAEFSMKRVLAATLDGAGVVNPGLIHVFANLTDGVGPDGLTVDASGNVYAASYNGSKVFVISPTGSVLSAIEMPDGGGPRVTNIILHDGFLYITEATNNEIWRVKTTAQALGA
jgi:gluconolactonase